MDGFGWAGGGGWMCGGGVGGWCWVGCGVGWVTEVGGGCDAGTGWVFGWSGEDGKKLSI